MDSIRTRPRIKLTPTPTQIGLSVFTAICMALAWLIFAFYYDKLPSTIPTHFGALGKPDQWGGKMSLIPLPIIITLMYALLTGLIRVPHIYNYPRPITPENAERQYGNAVALIYWLRASVVWIFLYIEWITIQTALGKAHGMGDLFLPVTLVVTFVPMIYYLIQAFKDR